MSKTTILVSLFGRLMLLGFLATSCRKNIEVEAPITSINSANVFSSDATAAAVLTGIYAKLSLANSTSFLTGSFSSINLFTGLTGDELSLYDLNNTSLSPLYRNAVTPALESAAIVWKTAYPIIFTSNAVIEGLSDADITPIVKRQLMGEAKFIRAYCYFFLINLYGDVPLVLGTDYKIYQNATRTSVQEVYKQIVTDLLEAESLLSASFLKADAFTIYSAGTEQRVRPTKWAAAFLLAKVYLYLGEYLKSENKATEVLNSALFSLSPLNSIFLNNSTETIFALQSVNNGTRSNTGDGQVFILPTTGPSSVFPVYLSNEIVGGFEPNDKRLVSWVGKISVGNQTYYYPNKYKIGLANSSASEQLILLRLAELYLIRSEARAQQNNLSGACSDLNIIRNRAGLSSIVSTDKNSVLTFIYQERKIELFTEWGNRWFDLIRSKRLDSIMQFTSVLKGGQWSQFKVKLPIPQSEINVDPNLIQNEGY